MQSVFKKRYRSYLSDIKLFERWGGVFPATSSCVVRYLREHETKLAPVTLRRRIAALSWYHIRNGYIDPTTTVIVSDTMHYIAETYNRPKNEAPPLFYDQLELIIDGIDRELEHPLGSIVLPEKAQMQLIRDRALLCVGWWRAFRASDISSLQVEHLQQVPGLDGWLLYQKKSKGDRQRKGKSHPMTRVSDQYQKTCPVEALNVWLTASQIEVGPIFPSIRSYYQWNKQDDENVNPNRLKALTENNINDLVKRYFLKYELKGYSSHSLRAGFVSEFQDQMTGEQMTLYVGWSSINTSLKYNRGISGLPFVQHNSNLNNILIESKNN